MESELAHCHDIEPDSAPGHGLPRLSRYVLGQLLGPVALLTLLMTSVIWLTQILPLLDLVINRGQSAPTFLYLILLHAADACWSSSCPSPFSSARCSPCRGCNGDSELVVMASAGYSASASWRCRC